MKILKKGRSKKMKKIIFFIISVVVLNLLFFGSSYAEEKYDVNRLIEELQQADFTVQEGVAEQLDLFLMVNLNVFPTCLGNNQNNLYMRVSVPPPVNEEKLPPLYPKMEWEGMQVNDPRFRLDPDEAILLIGKTPKECKYFGFNPYLYARYDEDTLKFQELLNSINDTINNMIIKTDGEDGNPFDAYTVIVFTADQTTEEKVRQSLINAGFPEDIYNLSVIPSSVIRLGTDFENDILMCGVRVYGPSDKEVLEKHVKNVPMQVFRVTPNNPGKPNPFPMPQLRVRGSGKTEMDLLPKMEELQAAIIEKYEREGWKATEYRTDVWVDAGLRGIQAKKDMLGDNRDAAYLKTESFTIYDNEFIVIFGVDNTRTGKSVYYSATIYGEQYINGVTGSNSMQWGGSVRDYLPEDPDMKKFFVLTSSRSNGLPEGGPDFVIPSKITVEGIHKFAPLFVGFRTYLEPETKVGPKLEELVLPRVIKFSKPIYP
jgi:hypothetical protein